MSGCSIDPHPKTILTQPSNLSGAFSEVRLATCKKTSEKFAVKIIDRSKCKGKEDMIETEVKILSRIDHPNIVKLYEKFEFDGKIYLVMELYDSYILYPTHLTSYTI